MGLAFKMIGLFSTVPECTYVFRYLDLRVHDTVLTVVRKLLSIVCIVHFADKENIIANSNIVHI
jgi:hypothetical protein